MENEIQIYSFIASFIYGAFLVLINRIFSRYIRNKWIFIQYLLASFLALDLAILYVAIMYFINDGVVHVYFILVMFLGMALASRVKLLSNTKKL